MTSESEYVPLAEEINEVRFLQQVKTFMMLPKDYEMGIQEDNEGTIKMKSNRFSSRRTRHIDMKHSIIREAI